MKRNRTERVITAFLYGKYRRRTDNANKKIQLRLDTRIESRRKSNMKIEYE